MNEELEFAHSQIVACARLARELRKTASTNWWPKPDGSRVSISDIQIEKRLMAGVKERFPDDGILSEESPPVSGISGRVWIFDPIDGTAPYLDGGSAWGTHVALVIEEEVVLGMISRPDLGEYVWAARGDGAYRRSLETGQQDRLQVSDTKELDAAKSNGLLEVGGLARSRLKRVTKWVEEEGIFVVEALASGRLDVVVDDGGHEWDQAPAVIITTEAGGKFSDDLGGTSIHRLFGLYSNGHLHAALLAQLNGGN